MPAPQLQTYGPADVHVYLDDGPDGTLRDVSLPAQSIGDWGIEEMMFDSARGFGQRWSSALPLGVAEMGELSLDMLVDTRSNSIDDVLGEFESLTPRTSTRTLRATWGPRTGVSDVTGTLINGDQVAGNKALVVDSGSAVIDRITVEQYVTIDGHAYRVTGTPTAIEVLIDRGLDANRIGLLLDVADDVEVNVLKQHFREVEGWIKSRILKLDRDNLQMWNIAFMPTDEVVGTA